MQCLLSCLEHLPEFASGKLSKTPKISTNHCLSGTKTSSSPVLEGHMLICWRVLDTIFNIIEIFLGDINDPVFRARGEMYATLSDQGYPSDASKPMMFLSFISSG